MSKNPQPASPRRLHPSPALAIACIALFASLGGVSYGLATGSIDSREIRDNTIRSKDVRNNSVYTRDIRNNDVRDIDIRNGTIKGRDVAKGALTGDNINMAKLGQVPDAAALGGRPAADYALAAAVAPDPVHVVGRPGEPPFSINASYTPGPYVEPGFWIDGAGVVHLQGTVTTGVGGGSLFTLPPGYRPAGIVRFRVPTHGDAATVAIDRDGVVGATGSDASLDGISFRAS